MRWLRLILDRSQNGDFLSQLDSFRGIPPLKGIAIKYCEGNGANLFCHDNGCKLFIGS
jgi:hypothetical protein